MLGCWVLGLGLGLGLGNRYFRLSPSPRKDIWV